jgi:hypothetical protein
MILINYFRYKELESQSPSKSFTPRPDPPKLPSIPLSELDGRIYGHLTYGFIQPCYVHNHLASEEEHSQAIVANSGFNCTGLLSSLPVRRILNITDSSIPTFIALFKSGLTTHLRLSHFSENIFNVTVFWTNAQVRLDEGFGPVDRGVWVDDADVVLSLEDHLIEWVAQGTGEGLAFKGNMWGMGAGAKEPEGDGKEGAEAWFSRVMN